MCFPARENASGLGACYGKTTGRLREDCGKATGRLRACHGAPYAFSKKTKTHVDLAQATGRLRKGYGMTTGRLREEYGKILGRLQEDNGNTTAGCVFFGWENASGFGTGYGNFTGRLREDYGETTGRLREDKGKGAPDAQENTSGLGMGYGKIAKSIAMQCKYWKGTLN